MKKRLLAIFLALILLLSGCAKTGETAETDYETATEPEEQEATVPEEKPPELSPAVNAAADKKFTIRYSESSSLNPYSGANGDNMAVTGLMYEGLVWVDSSFKAQPLLAKEWHTENGKTFIFTLNDDLYFTDGTPLTSRDVVYSITRARNSGRFMSRLDPVVSTVAAGENKVSITITTENYDFPLLMDVPIVKDGTGLDAVPVGTGPYYYKLIGETTACLAASEYYRDADSLSKKTLFLEDIYDGDMSDAFATRQLDILRSNGDGASAYNIHVESDTRFYDTTTLVYVGFNTQVTVMSDARIRRAISYAIDRDSLIAATFGGYERKAPVIFSSALDYYDEAWEEDTEYSIQKASEMFAEIGMDDFSDDGYLDYPIEDNWRVFTVRILVNSENSQRIEVAESVANALGKMGISTEIVSLPWSEYVDALEDGEFEMYIAETQIPVNYDLRELLSPGGDLNYGGISGNYPAMIESFLASQDDEARATAAGSICNKIKNEAQIIPLIYRRYSVVTHRGAVTGMAPSQSNIFANVASWEINP